MKTRKTGKPMGGSGKATLRAARGEAAELAQALIRVERPIPTSDEMKCKTEAYRANIKATVERLREDLASWIKHHSGLPHSPHPEEAEFSPNFYNEISAALLETAIDRYIKLHDAPDAFDFIKRAFDRQAAKHRRSLQ